MPSPFPGMDPYLEKHWGDVHTSLITYARDSLQPLLPRDLRARLEERLVVASDSPKPRSIFPDVRVFEKKKPAPANGNGMATLSAVATPLVIQLSDEVETQRFIEIKEISGGRLVTVLEILSPSNKAAGEGQVQYRRKQRELLDARVNLVEIDLIRTGDWVLAMPSDSLSAKDQTLYRVVVRRGWKSLQAEYYPMTLRARLPAIRVPLREGDPDVPLDLQALLEQCYRNGGYEDDIDYSQDPDPPLPTPDARWANHLLRSLGRRPRKPRRK